MRRRVVVETGQEFIAEFQRHLAAVAIDGEGGPLFLAERFQKRYALEEGSVIARRFQAHPGIASGHVFGRQVVARRAGVASFQFVVRQIAHIGFDALGFG